MSKKSELRPDQAITPDLYRTREGATEHSGHQPASKFSEQGSREYTGPREEKK